MKKVVKKTTKKVAAKKTTTTNLIIIDASGSMESKKGAVVSGLKELLAQIKIDAKKDKASVKTSTIVVDFSGRGEFNTLVNVNDSVDLDDNVSENYRTRGMTALYDAIGKGFKMVSEKEKNVFVSILTDGDENDSTDMKYEDVKTLIEAKKKLGWVITFQGTTEDSIKKAVSMGIAAGNTMSFADNSLGVVGALGTKGHPGVFTNARSLYYSNTLDFSVNRSTWDGDLLKQAAEKKAEDEKLNQKAAEPKKED